MSRKFTVSFIAATAAIGIGAISVSSGATAPSGPAERPLPEIANPVAAYSVLGRAAQPADALPHASNATTRRVHPAGAVQDVYLSLKGKDLCLVTTETPSVPGGTTCGAATGPAVRPPVLISGSAVRGGISSDLQVYGAAPDGVSAVRIVDGSGESQTVPVAENAFSAKLSAQKITEAPIKQLTLVWSDGATTTF